MEQSERLIESVILAAGGKITGRIRIQKIFYLLEQMGGGRDFYFSYHHYGPYSEDLSATIERAKYFGGNIKEEQNPIDGGFYSVYSLEDNNVQPLDNCGELSWDKTKDAVQKMLKETSVVIELAATAHWLKYKEREENWEKELRIRKNSKVTDDRLNKALALLSDIGLSVA